MQLVTQFKQLLTGLNIPSASIDDAWQTLVHHVSDIDYQQGRKAVLERFLQRPRLYFSEFFYTKFEQQARANLSQEIAELSV